MTQMYASQTPGTTPSRTDNGPLAPVDNGPGVRLATSRGPSRDIQGSV
jgi:hypothetical protein